MVARAGPGPLTEIEPDLQEDPIDKWRTNGVLPVWSGFLGFLVLAAVCCLKNWDDTGVKLFCRKTLCMECMTATTPMMKAKVSYLVYYLVYRINYMYAFL